MSSSPHPDSDRHKVSDEMENWTPADASSVLSVAVGSGQRQSQVGAALLDAVRHTLTLFDFVNNESGDQLEHLMLRLKPKTCLIPNTAGLETTQYAKKFHLNACVVVPCDKENFNDEKGLEYVTSFCIGSHHVLTSDLVDKHFALSAVAALIVVIEKFVTLAPKSLHLIISSNEPGMRIDYVTRNSLELFASASGDHKQSLFAFLNRTRTKLGLRLLRSRMWQPSICSNELIERQNCVQELIDKAVLFETVAEFLQRLHGVDLDGVTKNLTLNARTDASSLLEHQIDSVIYLKHVFALLPVLVQQLLMAESETLQRIGQDLSATLYSQLLQLTGDFLSDDAVVTQGNLNYRTAKVFALRHDVDRHLQIQRNIYCELVEDLNRIVDELDRSHELDGSLKLCYTASGGYFLEMPVSRYQRVRHIFFSCDGGQRTSVPSSKVKVTTHSVLSHNRQIKIVMQIITALTNGALQPLLCELRNENVSQAISRLKDWIAELDFLMSLALVAQQCDMQRPIFGTYTKLQDAANPLFLHLCRPTSRTTVTNDVFLKPGTPLILITGPNMSGKSGFLRQVALLQIMAQIGSFLPVKGEPVVRIVDRILTRIGCDDDIITTKSSFMDEIAQVQVLMSEMTSESLVIIDEMGRGTSDEDGVAICVSVCEELMAKGVLSVFATHYQDLVRLQELYPFVCSFVMEYKDPADETEQVPEFTYKVKFRPRGDSVAGDSNAMRLAQRIASMTEVAETARLTVTRTEVFRKELAVETTDQFEILNLIRHLKRLSCSQASVTIGVGNYLMALRQKRNTKINK